jgi:hypothetical protein
MNGKYWVKYGLFGVMSIPLAFLFERTAISWLPSWFPIGFTAGIPIWGMVVMACLGRFADVVSTISALESGHLAEGAPSLGRRPSEPLLFKLGIVQTVLILVAAAILSNGYLKQVRFALALVSLVSFSASVSNLWLSVAASSVQTKTFVGGCHSFGDYGGPQRDELSSFDALDLQLNEGCATVLAVPLSGTLLALLCINKAVLILAGAVLLVLIIAFAAMVAAVEAS